MPYMVGIPRKRNKTKRQQYFVHIIMCHVMIQNSFQACASFQYRCKNGQCVVGNVRCNNITQCEDASDEMNCRKLISV